MAGVSGGPMPWWQLPEYQGKLENLKSSAPAGYEYDPVQMQYIRTPTSQGQAVNAFNQAANPALAGLIAGLTSGTSGSGGGFTSSGSVSTSGGSGGSASSSSNGYGTTGVSGGNRLPTLQLPDQTAATQAAYASAKDQIGKSSRASLDALRGELGASGMLGGGAEAQAIRDVVQSNAGELGQVSRDQAMKSADLAADFAKTNYEGGITQRGQDVSAAEAQARLAQEARLADANLAFQKQQAANNQNLQMLQLALSGLKGLGGGSGLVY